MSSTLLTASRPTSQIRSLSSTPKPPPSPPPSATTDLGSLDDNHKLSKSTSTPQLSKMLATVAPSPQHHAGGMFHLDSAMNTIPDPRSPTPSSATSKNSSVESSQPQHPDLSNEVATLSNKLINAINLQTTLDDTLQATRQERDAALKRVTELERLHGEAERNLEKEVLEHDEEVERRDAEFRSELEKERDLRANVEKEKKSIEQELENLTSALFEEANTMVAAARKETEATEKKNDQLRGQLQDTESLLASQQAQLHDLKAVLEKLGSERDETELSTRNSTAPSTPAHGGPEKMVRMFDPNNTSPTNPNSVDLAPDHPLHFVHLVHPVMRNDLPSFQEFKDLVNTSRSGAPTRANSGNFTGLNIKGLGSQGNPSTASVTTSGPLAPAAPSSSSTGQRSPNLPTSPSVLPSLKDSRFYKRTLTEDIEPTLRLDAAPGVSWLSRRGILSSLSSSSLIVEPQPPQKRLFGGLVACALCGEKRKDDRYARRHRFGISDAEDGQRYPLCDPCLTRVRACCDYVGFLRMVKDGYWRADGEEETQAAFEECVKLRERMFWARLGGGVVPTAILPTRSGTPKSPALPTFTHQQHQQAPPLPRRSGESAGSNLSKQPPLTPHDLPTVHTIEPSDNDSGAKADSNEYEEKIAELANLQLHQEHGRAGDESENEDRSVGQSPVSNGSTEPERSLEETAEANEEHKTVNTSSAIPGSFD